MTADEQMSDVPGTLSRRGGDMSQSQFFVCERFLDGRWAAQAQTILAIGEEGGHFNIHRSLLCMSGRKALFALEHEDGDAEDAVGVMTYAIFEENEYRQVFRMDLLSVLPSHRRRGVAQSLLDAAYKLAVDSDCTEVDTLVSTFNLPMLRLIRKAGFGREVVRVSKRVEENRRSDDWEF